MAEQEQQRPRRSTDAQDTETTEPQVDGEETVEKIDDLLDEIDAVLEENAEEFVKNYVQKGGE